MRKTEEDADRRRRGDRRSRSRPGVKFFLLGGRRKSARRDEDKKQFIYVDQYRPWLLVAVARIFHEPRWLQPQGAGP